MCSGPIHNISEEDFKAFFEKFGSLNMIVRKRDDEDPRQFQRFAFIRFTETSAADKVMEAQNHVINGQVVHVRRVKDRM